MSNYMIIICEKSGASKDFLDFLVGLGQFVLAELDEFLGAFQLFRQLVDVEFIVLHLGDDGL